MRYQSCRCENRFHGDKWGRAIGTPCQPVGRTRGVARRVRRHDRRTQAQALVLDLRVEA